MRIIKQAIKDICFTVLVRAGIIARQGNSDDGRIVILMYHRINHGSDTDTLGLSISPLFFDRQLEFLKSHYKVISLADAVTMVSNGIPEGCQVVITFDDGYRDNYDYAFPLLKKHQIPATIFVSVDAVETGNFGWYAFDKAIMDTRITSIDLTQFNLGVIPLATRGDKERAIVSLHQELKRRDNRICESVIETVVDTLAQKSNPERIIMSWDEAREMLESGLVTIGSHTITHPILTRVERNIARDEIIRSKAMLEERLGTVVDLFAYPNGRAEDFDDEIIGMIMDAGYRAACTTIHGSTVKGENLFRLLRVGVTDGMCRGIGGRFSPEMFEATLTS